MLEIWGMIQEQSKAGKTTILHVGNITLVLFIPVPKQEKKSIALKELNIDANFNFFSKISFHFSFYS